LTGYIHTRIPREEIVARTCIHPLDVVRLTRQVGRWPAGTEGTVVSEHTRYLIVEIDDDDSPQVVDVPRGDLKVLWSPRTTHVA
jgi:hypothetical protein